MTDSFLPQTTSLGMITISEVYDFYDCPRLFLASNTSGSKYLGVSVAEDFDTHDVLLVGISSDRLARLKLGVIDLWQAFRFPESENAYILRIGYNDRESCVLEVLPNTLTEDQLPLPGVHLFHNSTIPHFDCIRPRILTRPRINAGLPGLDNLARMMAYLSSAINVSAGIETRELDTDRRPAPIVAGFPVAGSYELELFSPITESDTSIDINRRALARVLVGLRDASVATELQRPEAIIENSEYGLNARMCDLLAKMCSSLLDGDLEFKVDWNPDLPPSSSVAEIGVVKLSEKTSVFLSAAANKLREDVERQIEIVGGVVDLSDRERYTDSEEKANSKQIKILASDEAGRSKIYTVYVTPSVYEIALTAHRDRRLVGVKGTVVGRNRVLVDIAKFDLLGVQETSQTETRSERPARTVSPSHFRRGGNSLLHQLKAGIEAGEIASCFTLNDFRLWVRECNITKPDGSPYAPESIRKALDNACVGSTSTANTGELSNCIKRVTLNAGGRRLTYFKFIEQLPST